MTPPGKETRGAMGVAMSAGVSDEGRVASRQVERVRGMGAHEQTHAMDKGGNEQTHAMDERHI